MIIPIILIGLIVVFIYLLGLKNELYWTRRGVKYHDKNKVTGVFWDFLTRKGALFERLSELYDEYKGEPAVGMGSLFTPSLFVLNPRNVQHVVQADFSSFNHRGVEVNKDDQLADNILFMNGARWKLMRQSMTPLFTSAKLKNMYYIIDKSALDFVDYMKNNPKTWEGKSFDTLMTYANAALCGAIFGIGTESVFDSPFLDMAKKISTPSMINKLKFSVLNLSPTLTKIFNVKLFKEYEEFFVGAITKVIQQREKENVKGHDFADVCINIMKKGTMKDPTTGTELEPDYGLLTAQAMFFLLAGVEPVAIGIFTTLVELGSNTEILEKVHQEIDETFEKHGKHLTYDILSEMTYIDKVMSEAMRINPPVGYISRQCVKGTVLPVGNIKISEGTKMFLPIYNIHHDPDIYPEPKVFNPERFAAGNRPGDDIYMPFGMGNRTCIGARFSKLQMAAGIVHVLRHFTIKVKRLSESPQFDSHFNFVRRLDMDVEFVPRFAY